MAHLGTRGFAVALTIIGAQPVRAAETTIDLSGEVPDDPDRHFSIEFDVPAGTREIAVHQESMKGNVLDFGIEDPAGVWRGWAGSRIRDVVIGEQAATRSHVPGPIAAGRWTIVIGEADVDVWPATFTLQVTLRDAPTLAPQTDRRPYAPPAALRGEARWYAGDFHVHSLESNDARPPLDEIATFAKGRGLDFVHVSDHNTHTQLDYFVDAQARHPDFLFLPGAEYTTYWGHASAIGATRWVDDRTELPGRGIVEAVTQYHAQGALFSINHPMLDLGDLCIGCAWEQELPVELVDGVEIGTGVFGVVTDLAVEYWDGLCDQGRHLPALAGSDDHQAGQATDALSAPIGNPTTMVFAGELSVEAILEGIRLGRTVVKLAGPSDPMAEISSSVAPEGDTIRANSVRLTAAITGGLGYQARWVKNGEEQEPVEVVSDPFLLELDLSAPATGEDRWRVEVLESENGNRRTVTSHLWIEAGEEVEMPMGPSSGGCGCSVPRRGRSGWLAGCLWALALATWRRRAVRLG
jgi:hypothetical protein